MRLIIILIKSLDGLFYVNDFDDYNNDRVMQFTPPARVRFVWGPRYGRKTDKHKRMAQSVCSRI